MGLWSWTIAAKLLLWNRKKGEQIHEFTEEPLSSILSSNDNEKV